MIKQPSFPFNIICTNVCVLLILTSQMLLLTYVVEMFCGFQDPNWYRARNTVGREGTIPANYVQKREGVKSGGKLSLMP